jgi:NAD-reducing hydrogenase large subunit
MSQTITIDPVTRLEGHGKITIQLNDQGEVADAHFHVTQVRGFEKFCEGRPFYEMPSLTARICGICPVSHLLASAKACEAIMAVRIPHTAAQLRRLLNMAQMVQSHALSFFHLSSPDLLLGMESDPAARNIFGVAAARPDLGLAGIGLRRFGQHIIELLGTKRIHTGWVVPGGVTEPLAPAHRDEILASIPQAYADLKLALSTYKQIAGSFKQEISVFANFPSNYLGLINEDESIEFTDGSLRLIDPQGAVIEDGITASRFTEQFGEADENYSYTKFVYYKPLGYPQGSYRVGPLARLNIVKSMGTPQADKELAEFKQLATGPAESSFFYRANSRRSAHPRQACARRSRCQSSRGSRPNRGPARHAESSLQGGRKRQDDLGKPGRRHRPQQQRHEQGRSSVGQGLCQGWQVHPRRSQPHRGRDSHLRSLPQLLHPRLRADAPGSHARQFRR